MSEIVNHAHPCPLSGATPGPPGPYAVQPTAAARDSPGRQDAIAVNGVRATELRSWFSLAFNASEIAPARSRQLPSISAQTITASTSRR